MVGHAGATLGYDYDWQSVRPGCPVGSFSGGPSLALHGWQHAATLATSTSYRKRVVLPSLTAAGQALLRSQAGPHTGAWLTAIPSAPATTLVPHHIAGALVVVMQL